MIQVCQCLRILSFIYFQERIVSTHNFTRPGQVQDQFMLMLWSWSGVSGACVPVTRFHVCQPLTAGGRWVGTSSGGKVASSSALWWSWWQFIVLTWTMQHILWSEQDIVPGSGQSFSILTSATLFLGVTFPNDDRAENIWLCNLINIIVKWSDQYFVSYSWSGPVAISNDNVLSEL